MAITVGNVLVDVLPDARGFNEKLAAQLRDLTAKVKIDIDTGGVTARIDEVKARLAELGAKSPNIKVEVETAGAEAKLAAVGAEADRTSDKTKKAGDSASGAGGGMSVLMQAAIGLSPALAPVGAAALGVAAALGTMAAAAGAGFGVASIAIGGVVKAMGLLQQQTQAQQAAGIAQAQSAASNAAAISAAQRGIQSAEMSLGDARRAAANAAVSSAQQVAAAQYGMVTAAQQVTNAQYALIQAEQQDANAVRALQAAREAAQRQLQSSTNSLADARLAEKQAVLDLETAQRNYNITMSYQSATQQQRDQATLDLAKAQQHLTEAQQAATNAATDNAKVQSQGVANNPQVVTATQALAAAQHSVAQAHDGVASAQHQQQMAAQTLADAQAKAADQRIQSAESIVRAQQGVVAAEASMAAAQRQAAGQTSASLAAINAQIAALDPATRRFAEYLRGTWGPIWKEVQAASASGFLPGLQAGMDAMKSSMPGFVGFIRDISTRLGDMARNVGQAFQSPFWQSFFQFLSQTIGPSLSAVGTIIGNLVTGMAGLWMGFKPVIQPITDGIVGMSKKFADFGMQASSSVGFGKFIQYVKDSLPLVGSVVGNILRAVGEAVAGLAPLGTAILRLLDPIAKFLANDVIPFLVPIVRFIADQLAPVFGNLLAAGIDGARWALGLIMKTVQDNMPELRQLWSFIRDYLAPVLGTYLKTAFQTIGIAISAVIWIIARLIDSWNWLWQQGKALGHWFSNDFVNFFRSAWATIESGWDNLGKSIGRLWQNLKHYLMDPVAWVVQYVIDDGIIQAWDWVVSHLHLPSSWHADYMHVPAVPPLAYATGGVLPGYAPGQDTVHAMLSPGEGVLVPEAVRALGGAHGINAINSQFSSRVAGPGVGAHPGFAGGGVLSSILGSLSSLTPAGQLTNALAASGNKDMQRLQAIEQDPLGAMRSIVSAAMGGLSKVAPMAGMLGDMLGSMASGVGASIRDNLLKLVTAPFTTGSPDAVIPASRANNVAAVKTAAARYGWQSGAEWQALVNLLMRESGFQNTVKNPTSSAYGMFQFLDSTWAGYGIPKTSDPFLQSLAGEAYIANRYGDPLKAWAHETSAGWYDNGGLLPQGLSLAYNGTGGDEHKAVFTDNQWASLQDLASGSSRAGDGHHLHFHQNEVDADRIAKLAVRELAWQLK